MKKIVLLCLFLFLIGCVETTQKNVSEDFSAHSDIYTQKTSSVTKVEVLHFHGTNQCYSCVTVGDYAEETLNKYFADELKSGKIVFEHINGELPENSELVKKYGATGSSLWIGVYDEKGFHAEQNVNVWYKINNKKEYMDYLKGVIEEKLEGN